MRSPENKLVLQASLERRSAAERHSKKHVEVSPLQKINIHLNVTFHIYATYKNSLKVFTYGCSIRFLNSSPKSPGKSDMSSKMGTRFPEWLIIERQRISIQQMRQRSACYMVVMDTRVYQEYKNKCSNRSMGSETWNYDRPAHQPTDRRTWGVKGKFYFQ